jgi:hypothetical protein
LTNLALDYQRRFHSVSDGDSFHNDMALELLEEQADATIRRAEIEGVWHFSVVDVLAILTGSTRPRKYWSDLKASMSSKEGWSELSANIGQLKLAASDGKYYRTDATDTQTILRIIQSVPSPRAEPIKQWLAKVGAEKLEHPPTTVPPPRSRIRQPNLGQPSLLPGLRISRQTVTY